MGATLKVFARPGRMICDRKALEAGARRFIGRKHDPKLGPNGGWPRLDEAVEVESHADYVRAVREGDLIAADEETAKACGVKFDDHAAMKAEEHEHG